jgi:hypothetical protein
VELIAPPAGITLQWLPEPEKAPRDSFKNRTCLFRALYTPYKNILNKNIHRYVAQSGNLFYNDLYAHTMLKYPAPCRGTHPTLQHELQSSRGNGNE